MGIFGKKNSALKIRIGRMAAALGRLLSIPLALLLAACDFGFDGDSFQNKAGAYFKEMTSTASIESYKISPDNAPTDKSGNICLSYEDTYTIEFTLRNPQHYTFSRGRNLNFSLAQSGLPGSEQVSISQDGSDTTKLRMTFPADFLMQNATGANISPRISMMHPISFVSFGTYDKLKLSSDSPPPKVNGALTMQTTETPSRWVLCFNLPTKSLTKEFHSDIVAVSINGKSFDAAVADDGTISISGGSELTTTAPTNVVANQNTGLSFKEDGQPAYFSTGDEADEKEKIYTVVVSDRAGLSSSLAVSTRGFKLGAPDAYAKSDTQFQSPFVGDGTTKNSVEQEEDGSVYITIKAEPKTASFDYTDPSTGETKHVEAYDYDKGDACMMWEVYNDAAFTSVVSAGKINGLQGTISIPAGASWVRAFVRKPLYSDSEVITWSCRALFTKFFVSEEGDDDTGEGSRKVPYRTIQRGIKEFIKGRTEGDYEYDSACEVCVLSDVLTTPAGYDFSANNDCLIDVSDPLLYSNTIKISGDHAVKEVSAAQDGTAIRKLVNATYGKTIIEKLNFTGGAVEATDSYATSALIYVRNGATLNINNSKIYGNAFTSATTDSYEASVLLNSGSLAMSGTTICDNTAALTGGGSSEPCFYALWSVSTGAASGPTELTDCEITGHGENWTVVYVDGLPITMTGGAIKNNIGCNTVVQAAEMAELVGVEITGNTCQTAALSSYWGLFTLDGCTITGNVSNAAPALGKAAGIFINNIQSAFTIKGKTTIYDNHYASAPDLQSNLCIPLNKVITVGGNISGSKIGVSMPFTDAIKPTLDTPVVFTTDYATPAYENPAKPGNVFIAENGYGVSAMPSGMTGAGEAAFAVSAGGMYGAEDYTITFDTAATGAYTGKAKTVTVTVSATRKEPSGSAPVAPTDLWYNSAKKQFFLASDHTEPAAGDETVTWTAGLYSGSGPAYPDLAIGAADGGITVTIPAIDYDANLRLKVSANFMGAVTEREFAFAVNKGADNVADYISSLTTAGTYEVQVEGVVGPAMDYSTTETTAGDDGLAKVAKAMLNAASNVMISLDARGTSYVPSTSDPDDPLADYNDNAYFHNCANLKEMYLPDWMEYIVSRKVSTTPIVYNGLFEDCSGLVKIEIPATVTTILNNAFKGCSSLATIKFGGTVEQWKNIYFVSGWRSGVPAGCSIVCSDGNAPLGFLEIRGIHGGTLTGTETEDRKLSHMTNPVSGSGTASDPYLFEAGTVDQIAFEYVSDDSLSFRPEPSGNTWWFTYAMCRDDSGNIIQNCQYVYPSPSSATLAAWGHETRAVRFNHDKASKIVYFRIAVPPLTGVSINMPAGGKTFQMGYSGEPNSTPHSVTLTRSFWICDHETTQAEYQDVMGTNPSGYTSDDDFPVQTVSWYDAIYYCNKRSAAEGLDSCYKVNGKEDPDQWGYTQHSGASISGTITCDFSKNGYRLPTEAEWEFAARGIGFTGELTDTANNVWAGTATEDDVKKYAWYTVNSSGTPHAVKTEKQAGVDSKNAAGLYDMSGNVWEWCWDWCVSDYYTTSEASGPDPTGASTGSNRVARGGSWSDTVDFCSIVYRLENLPSNRNTDLGFRVVRTMP